MTGAGERLVARERRRWPTGDRYAFSARRRRAPARPARPPAARRPARPVGAVRRRRASRGPTPPGAASPLEGAVIYETHVGTFTPEGTLDAAIERLPTSSTSASTSSSCCRWRPFPGRHGWGYDGVAPYSVHEAYGGPAALQRFVDAAHAHGLGVCLDVVYNHLGPDGNYLGEFGPYFDRRARHSVGPGGQPRRRRTATRCGAGCSTTCGSGCATSTSTGCGSTRSTSCTTTAPLHAARGDGARGRRARRRDRPAAVAGRRVRPQRPRHRHPARRRRGRRRARACTASGPTTCTTRCTSR